MTYFTYSFPKYLLLAVFGEKILGCMDTLDLLI